MWVVKWFINQTNYQKMTLSIQNKVNKKTISSIYNRLKQKNQMDRFQHIMRTTQHTKSVEMIMTRTNHHFFNLKSPHKKPSPQGDNITTYLRKIQINRQNQNLAKRIMQCESQHSRDRYMKQWYNVKRFLRVRSNFKKTLHAQEPKIYRFQPILGKGRLRVDIQIKDIQTSSINFFKKNLYKFSFILGNTQIQPDKKLITVDFMKQYNTSFYAPLFLKNKSITCRILQINQNNQYQSGRFQIVLAETGLQASQILNKFGRCIGKVKFQLNLEGGRKKLLKRSTCEKENFPLLNQTQNTNFQGTFSSQSRA